MTRREREPRSNNTTLPLRARMRMLARTDRTFAEVNQPDRCLILNAAFAERNREWHKSHDFAITHGKRVLSGPSVCVCVCIFCVRSGWWRKATTCSESSQKLAINNAREWGIKQEEHCCISSMLLHLSNTHNTETEMLKPDHWISHTLSGDWSHLQIHSLWK